MPKIKSQAIANLGKAFLREISDRQPDRICRNKDCGCNHSKFEVTTEKGFYREKIKHGFAVPCCGQQACYNACVDMIRQMIG